MEIKLTEYSRTSPYCLLSNTDTPLLRTVPLVPEKCPYIVMIVYKENLSNTETLLRPFGVRIGSTVLAAWNNHRD